MLPRLRLRRSGSENSVKQPLTPEPREEPERKHPTTPILQDTSTDGETGEEYVHPILQVAMHGAPSDDIDSALKAHGYQLLGKVKNTSQGCLLRAIRLKDNQMMAIKRTSKLLHKMKISEQDSDGNHMIVERNTISESIIVHHLTIVSRATSRYIASFADFFETELSFYLCTTWAGDMTLREFVDQCHSFLKAKRLKWKQFEGVMKYLMWQISSALVWLHNAKHCCHLDLHLDNIMLQNARFIVNTDKSITIQHALSVRLVDFGLSEMFSTDDFSCRKHAMTSNLAYAAPKAFRNETYDATCADMWCLGIMFYYMCCGRMPYKYPNAKQDVRYAYVKQKCIAKGMKKHICCSNPAFMALLCGLLSTDERARYSAKQVLQSTYLSLYFSRFGKTVLARLDAETNQSNDEWRERFPFYQSKQ